MVANLTTRLGQLTSSPAGGPYTGANKIINGDMAIDQRNAGASALVGVASPQYFVDRFGYQCSVTSKLTAGQDYGGVTPPAGFAHYLGAKVTTAYATGAGDYFSLQQKIEGQNCADLNWGTANAKAVTLSFWVYSSVTGTFGGVIQNSASNRSYPFTYTISVASTWEQKTITVAGDTTGTWLTTTGIGMEIAWGLGVGATYSGTAGAWAAANYISATGATNIINTLNATFYVTGVKLEVGSIATPFVPDDYAVSWDKCKRYYQKYTYGASGYITIGQTESTTTGSAAFNFTQMRSAPSVTLPAAGSGAGQMTFLTGTGAYPAGFGSNAAGVITVTNFRIIGTGYTGLTATAGSILFSGSATTSIILDAEL